MTDEVKDAMLEYEELKIKEKEIGVQLEELKKIILPAMGDEPINARSGVFEIKKRTSWKYSPELVNRQEEVKKLEKDEVAKGIATPSVSTYLQYNHNKELPTE